MSVPRRDPASRRYKGGGGAPGAATAARRARGKASGARRRTATSAQELAELGYLHDPVSMECGRTEVFWMLFGSVTATSRPQPVSPAKVPSVVMSNGPSS